MSHILTSSQTNYRRRSAYVPIDIFLINLLLVKFFSGFSTWNFGDCVILFCSDLIENTH